jgi:hypothetical protein
MSQIGSPDQVRVEGQLIENGIDESCRGEVDLTRARGIAVAGDKGAISTRRGATAAWRDFDRGAEISAQGRTVDGNSVNRTA